MYVKESNLQTENKEKRTQKHAGKPKGNCFRLTGIERILLLFS